MMTMMNRRLRKLQEANNTVRLSIVRGDNFYDETPTKFDEGCADLAANGDRWSNHSDVFDVDVDENEYETEREYIKAYNTKVAENIYDQFNTHKIAPVVISGQAGAYTFKVLKQKVEDLDFEVFAVLIGNANAEPDQMSATMWQYYLNGTNMYNCTIYDIDEDTLLKLYKKHKDLDTAIEYQDLEPIDYDIIEFTDLDYAVNSYNNADYVFVSNSAIDVTFERTNYSNKLYKKVNGKLQEV